MILWFHNFHTNSIDGALVIALNYIHSTYHVVVFSLLYRVASLSAKGRDLVMHLSNSSPGAGRNGSIGDPSLIDNRFAAL